MKNKLKWLAGITLVCGSMLLTVQDASASQVQNNNTQSNQTTQDNNVQKQQPIIAFSNEVISANNNANNNNVSHKSVNNNIVNKRTNSATTVKKPERLSVVKRQATVRPRYHHYVKHYHTNYHHYSKWNRWSRRTRTNRYHYRWNRVTRRHNYRRYKKPIRRVYIKHYRIHKKTYRHNVRKPIKRIHKISHNIVNNNSNYNNNTNNNGYRKMKQVQRENYYTYIDRPSHWHNWKGFEIFKAPYGTSANSYNQIGYQSQIKHHVIHVLKSANVANNEWIMFRDLDSRMRGWIKYDATVTTTRWLKVPLISQRPQLPTGCEITATTMMLRYHGNHVNKIKLANEMPRSANPYRGFVGSPYSVYGWYIWPSGLVPLVNHYTHGHALNMTGWSERSIIRQINRGIPVVMWVANLDGFVNHAITINGYTKNRLIFNDPWRDLNWSMNANSLWYLHALDHYRALSYWE